jgi:hypothetical protein
MAKKYLSTNFTKTRWRIMGWSFTKLTWIRHPSFNIEPYEKISNISEKPQTWLDPICSWMIISPYNKLGIFMWIGNPRWPQQQTQFNLGCFGENILNI